jgi:hypothetical protein
MGWTHIIVEGFCKWDFKRKKDWRDNKAPLPIVGCKKVVSNACLGEAIKCPHFLWGEVEPWERKTMISAWLKEGKIRERKKK